MSGIQVDTTYEAGLQRILKVPIQDCLEIAKALSTQLRIDIFLALSNQPMNVAEIAERFNLPVSTAASNISILEEAGLIITNISPGTRGRQKLCAVVVSKIVLESENRPTGLEDEKFVEVPMPIGNYSAFDVAPTCGLASALSIIGEMDDPASFYEPTRTDAQLIWFQHGYLEYQFPNRVPKGKHVKSVELTMEVCSEAPLHNANWPSDLTVWVNGHEIGTWTSPGDFGGERGYLTPAWWASHQTQYGVLKTWRVSDQGTHLDGRLISSVTLDQVWQEGSRGISIRLGVKEDSDNVGGMNLFGRQFGNYETDLVLRLGYSSEE